jgi:hypothetical protein
LGVFISPDPSEPYLLPGVGANRYAYALGDPVNALDPGGEDTCYPAVSNWNINTGYTYDPSNQLCFGFDHRLDNQGIPNYTWWLHQRGQKNPRPPDQNLPGPGSGPVVIVTEEPEIPQPEPPPCPGAPRCPKTGDDHGINLGDVLSATDPAVAVGVLAATVLDPNATNFQKVEALQTAGINLTGVAALGIAAKFVKATSITIKGFGSFSSFKRATGAAGEGLQWHHVVEQDTEQCSQVRRFKNTWGG